MYALTVVFQCIQRDNAEREEVGGDGQKKIYKNKKKLDPLRRCVYFPLSRPELEVRMGIFSSSRLRDGWGRAGRVRPDALGCTQANQV